ncbi:dienelactone hydrolase [Aspergillus saccharolyticus JOP 1030-1]|uniref:Riboflavin kinase n=1 Tax=Aspergillus saccharolyticus JOP 1030-1 TaxID=1450539 RepID=A0A318ZJN2_9EURO|nr:hypothetical protein BP01DRAFT_371940 [Aspergillus saccharolyticus JOP 1030-1]PYH47739.1 hypothetical protein BP01DRAFT_371940 [Aspergillus saccharolyticus JOP 1030-1]
MRPDGPRDPVTGPDGGPVPPYPIRLAGPVIKGFGRGSKELGIPTANIPAEGLAAYPALQVGVYYGVVALDPARSALEDDSSPIRPAVLSIGYNPFYKNQTRSIEIHIMPSLSAPSPTADGGPTKFHKLPDFYGTDLHLLILGYIRPEYDYVSLEALVEDIRLDCEVARRSLQRPAYACYLAGNDCAEDVREARQWLTRSSSGTTPLQSPPSFDRRRKEVDHGVPRRLYLTSDTPEFDAGLLARFRAEGFDVEYLPFPGRYHTDRERDRKELEYLLQEREDDLEPGERYAVVAYSKPASLLLESHHQPATSTNPFPRLCALVAYYPQESDIDQDHLSINTYGSPVSKVLTGNTNAHTTTSSSTAPTSYPPSVTLLPIQIHLAGDRCSADTKSSTSTHTRKRHRCHSFFYPESSAGFAEPSSPTYDGIAARLAWSRALEVLKRGFGWPGNGAGWKVPDVETVWEEYWRCLAESEAWLLAGEQEGSVTATDERERLAAEIVGLMVGSSSGVHLNALGSCDASGDEHSAKGTPSVNCVPTLMGGTTSKSLIEFFTTQFLPTGPPDQRVRLLSRTTGADRIIDELHLSFTHTEEIPWLLPSVPPTDRPVRIALVMAASFCAGKLARLNVYWDQASVLMQIGLLDPALVPSGFSATGPNRAGSELVDRIPVVGAEGVERILA